MTRATRLAGAVRAAALGELVWRDADGGPPQALGVVPLLLGDQPVVALPWANVDRARSAAAAGTAGLVLSEPRMTGPGWTPLAARGRLTLVEDTDGALFVDQLLEQEVRKHPPARALVDSNLVRREHWWYLPRLVLLLDAADVAPVAAREDARDAVLAVDDGDLHVATVRVADWDAHVLDLIGGPSAHGPAALVGQEVSVPDAERWTVHRTTGRYDDGRLTDVAPAASRELEPVPGLLARVRRQRTLERACVANLKAAGR